MKDNNMNIMEQIILRELESNSKEILRNMQKMSIINFMLNESAKILVKLINKRTES